MSSARVDDDIQIVEEGNKGVSQQHIEPNVIINLSGESGHVSSAGVSPDLLQTILGHEAGAASPSIASQAHRWGCWRRPSGDIKSQLPFQS